MRLFFMAALALLTSACVTEVQPCSAFNPVCDSGAPPGGTSIEASLEAAHNQARAAAGIEPLAHSDRLAYHADLRCLESPHEWATGTIHAGFFDDSVADGENMAQGYNGSVTQVMSGWMASGGHRANILESSFTRLGVSYCFIGGQHYWVVEFGF